MAVLLRALAIGCVLAASASARLLRRVRDEDREFDYFMFVRQWPGNYCSQHECPLLHDLGNFHFTIHGLWPNYNDGTWPQFCDKNYKFDENEVDDLLGAMQNEWPSFYNSDETFWDHEWSKHGTCALDVFRNEHKYFKKVLRLHWKYDLAAALRAADIVPSAHHTYRTADLVKAIRDMYGARVLVHCYNKSLSEIWMCIGKDMKPFDCDASHESGSCDELTIPPLPGSGHRLADVATAAAATAGAGAGASQTAGPDDSVLASLELTAGQRVEAAGAARAVTAAAAASSAAAATSAGVQAAAVAAAGPHDSIFNVLSASMAATKAAVAQQVWQLLAEAGYEGAASHSKRAVAEAGEQEREQEQERSEQGIADESSSAGGAAAEGASGQAAATGGGDDEEAAEGYSDAYAYVDWLPDPQHESAQQQQQATTTSQQQEQQAGAAGAAATAAQALTRLSLQAASLPRGTAPAREAAGEGQASGEPRPTAPSAAEVAARVINSFVWQSRLRAHGAAFSASDDAENGLAAIADGDGDMVWAVQRAGSVLASSKPTEVPAAAVTTVASGCWVMVLQLACVSVIVVCALALVAMTCAARARGEDAEGDADAAAAQRRPRCPWARAGCAGRLACSRSASGDLAEPLLLPDAEQQQQPQGRAASGASGCTAGGRAGAEEEDDEASRAALRAGILVVLPEHELGASSSSNSNSYAPMQ